MPADLISRTARADRAHLSPRRLVVLLVVAMAAIAWTVTGVWIMGDRQRIYRSAATELTGAIPVLKVHARRSFDTAHTILVALDEALQTGGADVDLRRLGMLALKMQSNDADPIGIAIISASEHLTRIGSGDPEVDVSNRDYMNAIRNSPPGSFFIGKPLPSRISGRAVIPMVMKTRQHASGIGAILAAIPVSNFEEAYRDLLVSAPSAIGLLRDDGVVLHLTPDPRDRIGSYLPGFDLATLSREHPPMTAFERDSIGELKMPIMVSYATIDPYPLIVGGALRIEALQEVWLREAWPKAAGVFVGSIIVILLAAWLLVLMSRRDAAMRRVTEALVELEAANRAKRDFMARMSHELRTPLNAILGFSELIGGAMLGPVPKTYQDYGRDIHRSGAHLLDMINQVLDITRIETGSLHPKLEPVEIDAVAAEVAMILRPLADGRKVKVKFEFEADARQLLADPMMLRQMLLNLVSNAVKFSPTGAAVVVESGADENGVVVTVSDRGPGIDKDKLKHVFEPFGSGQSLLAQQAAGIGLGLPIAKKLVEMHGGRLTITTSRQKGTVVTLVFPAECRIAA
ncbi:sensor histidine kinase [Ferrovibrio sp.]|uniref:sensor histidine kinase n=1 Tax=Ferrovibrio sp. TaxID=1917215 RepID=UPI0025C20B62|nr:sensor histidine kinase [Ferrovibrio sp.]